MIKIKCVVCGQEIVNPTIVQKTCAHKCSKAYQKAYNKAYMKTDKWKAYMKAYMKAYNMRKKEERGK